MKAVPATPTSSVAAMMASPLRRVLKSRAATVAILSLDAAETARLMPPALMPLDATALLAGLDAALMGAPKPLDLNSVDVLMHLKIDKVRFDFCCLYNGSFGVY